MAQIANYDAVISARCAGLYQDIFWTTWYPSTQTALTPEGWSALADSYAGDGNCFSHTSLATLSSNGTLFSANSSAGALRPPVLPPSGGRQKWITLAGAATPLDFMRGACIADLLWACKQSYSALSVNVGAFPALRRYATGAGVQIAVWASAAALGNAAQRTITITYTNQDGTPGRTATVIARITAQRGLCLCAADKTYGGTSASFNEYPFATLQGTDTGVRAITNISYDGSLTSGTIIVALVRPLVWLPPSAHYGHYVAEDLLENPGGPVELVVGSDGQPGCITVFGTDTLDPCMYFMNTVEV